MTWTWIACWVYPRALIIRSFSADYGSCVVRFYIKGLVLREQTVTRACGQHGVPPIPSSWPDVDSKAFPSTSSLFDYRGLRVLLKIRKGLNFFSGHRVCRLSHAADGVNTGVLYPDSRISSDGWAEDGRPSKACRAGSKGNNCSFFHVVLGSVPNSERPVCANFFPVTKRRPVAPPKTSLVRKFSRCNSVRVLIPSFSILITKAER